MVVDRESGQSLLEFLFLLPVLVGLAMILIHVNSAIQISIVNQKHSIGHTLWYTFNSPYYPEKRFFRPVPFHQMVIGVSDALTTDEDGSRITPRAATQLVARTPGRAGGTPEPQSEPGPGPGVGRVRVRNTVTLCTHPTYFLGGGGARTAIEGAGLVEGITPQQFDYCARSF